MVKQCIFFLSVAVVIVMFPGFPSAQEVPHPSLNIPYLCTFGQESAAHWGDDDFSQSIFISVPENVTTPLYISIFDPDVGGKTDEIQKGWDTETRFELYGGTGAYTDPDAKGVEPEGNYKSGTLIVGKTYGIDHETDGKWAPFAQVEPNQGELVDGYHIFKIIVEGIEGDDGNLYKLAISASPSDRSLETMGIEVFSYEWSFRLPNETGTMIYTFPFVVPRDAHYVISNIWDFDNDNMIYLNTPSRPGIPLYSTGNDEWAVTKYSFGVAEKTGDESSDILPGKRKRWFSTTYDVMEEDFEAPWTLQIHKGIFRNNDIVLSINDISGRPFRTYSTARPRSGRDLIMNGKVYESKSVITEDILFIERDAQVNTDVTLAKGTVLPKGTKLAKGTRIPQDMTIRGRLIPEGTVLNRDITIDSTIVIHNQMILKKGSVIAKGAQIAKGSILFEGLAPRKGVLPPCNTVFLDASETRDPDDNPLIFNWDLGDGSYARGARVIHSYREPGSYVVSLIVSDNSGAVNDAASKAITIIINDPPVAKAGKDRWACAGEAVYFEGAKSYDPDGSVIKYKWIFGDGASASGASVSHAYKRPGKYSVRLDIMDDSGSTCNTDSDGFVVTVNDGPVAKAGNDINSCDYSIRFDGRESFDRDGEIAKYLWYFGDGNVGEGPTLEHTYTQPGVYNVKLVVSDDSGAMCNTDSDEMFVSINAPPVANAGPDRSICVGKEMYFDGAASSDPNDEMLTYRWNFGDGTRISRKRTPVHVYKNPGQYTVSLTVADDSGTVCTTSTATALITVDTRPVAEAGADQVVGIGQSVIFDGSVSRDPNDYPLNYKWTFGDLSEPAGDISPTHAYDKPGVYRVLLTVKNKANSDCNTDSDGLTVTVNNPPTARAGVPIVTHSGEKTMFDASESFDPDGSIVEYEWDFGDQTPPARYPNSKAVHSYAKPGNYTVTLTVRDNTGLPGGIDTDTVPVMVNFPPVADAGENMIRCIGQVIFDGTGSKDPDGNIIAYKWDFGDGKTGEGGRPVHIYESSGVYNVMLTLTDNSGTGTSKDSDTVIVEINSPPVMDIGKEMMSTCPHRPTPFDASASYDSNDDPISFDWDFGDGENGTGRTVTHIYKRPGQFVVKATGSDGREMVCSHGTASMVVIVNDSPIADAGPDQLVNPGEKVSFDASGSTDSDGKIAEYLWNFNDGTAGKGVNIRHVYTTPGRYDVRLTIQDDSGLICNEASDEMTVTVNAPPIADAGPDQTDICSGTVQFDGTRSRDSDGSIISYEWDFGDGSPIGAGPSPSHIYAKPGSYNVMLMVTDDSKLESGKTADTMNLVINDPPVARIQAKDTACPGVPVKVSAKDSYDSDGHITVYEWDFGDGSSKVRGRNASHVYRKSGKYTVTLTVTDNSGSVCGIGTMTYMIAVNTPPVAEAGDDMVTCIRTTDCSVTLDAGNSRDEDGDILTYYWNFGDGTRKKGIHVQHVYKNPGTYTVTLIVADDTGTTCNQDTDTLKITANAPPDVELKKGKQAR